MEYTNGLNQWKWIEIDTADDSAVKEITNNDYLCKRWVEQINEENRNHLRMSTVKTGEEALWGSVVYQQSIEEQQSNKVLHFYLTRDLLLTNQLDYTEFHSDEVHQLKRKMKTAESAIEVLLVILGSIMNGFLYHIDEYEERLQKLLWDIKKNNDIKTLNRIALSRHELLIWKNLIIPIVEIKMAILEAFGEDVSRGVEYIRTCQRIERGRTLMDGYQRQIDTMTDLENVVSTHRGNEIMKTLTVLTTLFTPVAAWGALWGMNFKVMPELEWKMGYLIALVIIILNTVGLYMYLRRKGWTGDILNVKKKNSFFK